MKRKSTMAIGVVVFCFMMMLSGAAWCADNGTVTIGGLVALKDASCLGKMSWSSAKSMVAALSAATAPTSCNLKDDSTAGKWRLPNYSELSALCASAGQLVNVAQYNYYWSSSSSIVSGYYSVISFNAVVGGVGGCQNGSHPQGSLYYVVPVRNQ